MKNRITLLTLAVSSVLSAQLVAAPLITDYQQATSSYEDAYVSGKFNANGGNQEQASYNLDLTLDYEKVFSSPSRNTKVEFLGSGFVNRGANKGDKSVNSYQALGSTTVDSYFKPGSAGGFWYGRGAVGVKKGQESPFTKATIGIGYGRVVNVTPMARSIRIIESLSENGFLKAEPSNQVYQSMADIIDRESEYRSKYGAKDYAQYWVQDIEQVLNQSGVIKSGKNLSARAVIKSYDVLTKERISARKSGWLVRAGIGAVLTDYDGEKGKPAVELGAEYHKAITNQTQFSNESVLTATLKDGDSGFVFNNAMSLTHELTDKIDWENKWTLSHNESDSANDLTTNTLSSTFLYGLTNTLDFSVEARLSDLEDNIDNNGNDKLDKSFTVGLKYRLK